MRLGYVFFVRDKKGTLRHVLGFDLNGPIEICADDGEKVQKYTGAAGELWTWCRANGFKYEHIPLAGECSI